MKRISDSRKRDRFTAIRRVTDAPMKTMDRHKPTGETFHYFLNSGWYGVHIIRSFTNKATGRRLGDRQQWRRN